MYRIVGVVDEGPSVQVLTGATTLLGNRMRAPVHCEVLTRVARLGPAVLAERTHAVVIRWDPSFHVVDRRGLSGIARGLRWWGTGRAPVPAAIWMYRSAPERDVLRMLTEWGFETLWETRSSPDLAHSLGEMIRSRKAARFLRALDVDPGSELGHAIRAQLTPTRRWPSPEELGRGLLLGRSSLYRKFRCLGLPPPRELMGWIRAYLALCLLEEGRPLKVAARETGFSRPPDLLRMVNRRIPVSDELGLRTLGSEGVLNALKLRATESGGGDVRYRSCRKRSRPGPIEQAAHGWPRATRSRVTRSVPTLTGASRFQGSAHANIRTAPP